MPAVDITRIMTHLPDVLVYTPAIDITSAQVIAPRAYSPPTPAVDITRIMLSTQKIQVVGSDWAQIHNGDSWYDVASEYRIGGGWQ